MSTTLKKTFVNFINEGATAASLISESDKKAMAYAALANAIAQSGLLSDNTTTIPDMEEKVEEKKEEPKGKEAIKKGAGKTKSRSKAKAKEEKKEEPAINEEDIPTEPTAPVEEQQAVEENVQAPVPEAEGEAPAEEVQAEIVDEWTDEVVAEKQESLATLQWYKDNWTEEYVEQCVKAWFEDDSVTLADIRPSNIDGFLLYLYELAQQAQE